MQALASAGGSIAGGLASMIPVVGPLVGGAVSSGASMAGMQAAQQITTAADRLNELDAALNGNAKSVTMLNAELQMIMSQWKNLNDALGNVMKTLSDMAQNSIRNMRA